MRGALVRCAYFAHRRPAYVVAALTLLTGLALASARNLRVDPDMVDLLPQSFPSVQALEQLKDNFGGTGFVTVVLAGDDPKALERVAE